MLPTPAYFLIRYEPTHFVCYGRGVPISHIPRFSEFHIVQLYPVRKDLTPRLVAFQRKWRQRRQFRKWCGHPARLFYREQTGRFPFAMNA
jgi:hypothetical protein